MTLDDEKAIQKCRLVRSVISMFLSLVAITIILSFVYAGHLISLFSFLGLLAIAVIFWQWHDYSSQSDKQDKCIDYLSRIIALLLVISTIAVLIGSAVMLVHHIDAISWQLSFLAIFFTVGILLQRA